jgi:hypothetical protein
MYTHAERILRIWLFRTDKRLCGQCAKTLLDFGCGPCEKFFLQSWNAFTAFKFVSPNTCRFPPAPCHFPSETCAFLFFCVSSKHILAAYWQFRYLPHVWQNIGALSAYRRQMFRPYWAYVSQVQKSSIYRTNVVKVQHFFCWLFLPVTLNKAVNVLASSLSCTMSLCAAHVFWWRVLCQHMCPCARTSMLHL